MTIFYCLIFEALPTWGPGSHFYVLQEQGCPVIPPGTGFPFESYITTDSQSACLSWNKAPICGLRPNCYFCQTVPDMLMWSALSDERTGLSFTIAAGPCQRSHLLRLAGLGWRYSTPPPTGVRVPFSSSRLAYNLSARTT
jgi:hypothetical protein